MEKGDNSLGGGGTPGSGLSREEVMAQRAEKKKLKEARKNKSAGGGGGGDPKESGDPGMATPKKEEVVGGGGGESGTQAAGLSREEVMAQRAEKKKLKEARKNKSGGGGGGGGDLEVPDEKKGDQTKKPKQQPQSGSQGAPKVNKNSEQKKQGPQAPVTTETSKQSGKGPKQQQPKKSPSPAPAVSEPKASTKTEKAGGAPEVSSTETVTITPVTKTETPDRTIKSKPELQSTIQSLFQVKKSTESGKNKKFQLHPLFYSLGVKLRNNVIRGTNDRCIALLNAIKEYVKGYQTPPGTSFKHELSKDLQENMDALREKSPFAIGMNNAVEFLNAFLFKVEEDILDINQQKEEIMESVEQYIEEKIEKAVEAIVMYGVDKIKDRDVLMIYSVTEAVLNLLARAGNGNTEGKDKKSFELIIIQTPETQVDIPVLLKKLSKPVEDQKVIISSVNFPNAIYRIRHCTKLIIGGHGLFTNGGVMAQSGSGQLALLASTYNKPTIFLCETYKFCERSPLDFFTLDEYIPEEATVQEDLFQPKIKYDVTPANLVTVVVTDIDLLPSTSVPVVLRVK